MIVNCNVLVCKASHHTFVSFCCCSSLFYLSLFIIPSIAMVDLQVTAVVVNIYFICSFWFCVCLMLFLLLPFFSSKEGKLLFECSDNGNIERFLRRY